MPLSKQRETIPFAPLTSQPSTSHLDPSSLTFIDVSTLTLQDWALNELELTIVVCRHPTSINYDNSHFPCRLYPRASSAPLNTLNTYIKIQTLNHCNRRRDFLQRWYPCTLNPILYPIDVSRISALKMDYTTLSKQNIPKQ